MSLPDNYTAASGETIYCGMAAPGITPGITTHALKRVADIYAANSFTRNGVDSSSPSDNGAIFDFTGIGFAAWLGAKGSLIMTGGGHNGWFGNDLIRYDNATALWSRITNPWTTLWRGAGDYSDDVYGELFADSSLTTTLQTQPGAAHLYDHTMCLPPGTPNVGAQGGILTLWRYGTSPNAHLGKQTHIYDFT